MNWNWSVTCFILISSYRGPTRIQTPLTLLSLTQVNQIFRLTVLQIQTVFAQVCVTPTRVGEQSAKWLCMTKRCTWLFSSITSARLMTCRCLILISAISAERGHLLVSAHQDRHATHFTQQNTTTCPAHVRHDYCTKTCSAHVRHDYRT